MGLIFCQVQPCTSLFSLGSSKGEQRGLPKLVDQEPHKAELDGRVCWIIVGNFPGHERRSSRGERRGLIEGWSKSSVQVQSTSHTEVKSQVQYLLHTSNKADIDGSFWELSRSTPWGGDSPPDMREISPFQALEWVEAMLHTEAWRLGQLIISACLNRGPGTYFSMDSHVPQKHANVSSVDSGICRGLSSAVGRQKLHDTLILWAPT